MIYTGGQAVMAEATAFQSVVLEDLEEDFHKDLHKLLGGAG